MRLLIKYATRGRPELFLQALSNINNTISTDDYLIMVSADEDDNKMNNDFIKTRINDYKNVKIIFGISKNKVDAINRDMEGINFKILINMSDDMCFIRKGWEKIIEQRVIETWGTDSLDWFAHFNDGFVFEKLPTMSIMGREYYDRTKHIYHPSYGSVSCDAEAMYVAMMLGRYKYFNDNLFVHKHPANMYMPTDDTYRRNDKYGQADTENYFNRRKNLFYVKNPTYIPFNPNTR